MLSIKAPLMTSVCIGFDHNPAYNPDESDAPMLLRCHCEASRRLILQGPDDVYTLKLCPHHAVLQRRQAARNGWTILDDEPVKAVAA